ncbi:Hypothetical predicted protein [Pelobates cultripes]|uniref:Uncharacterized protein n=1 Tax=Pelobates cultripes TaxID=61616 RepID=A0AAD1T165_PELCU|nr:Hypothetical predicted protein [Pelobates cultripes]
MLAPPGQGEINSDTVSDVDSSPVPKGNIKHLLLDIRKVWKSDLKEAQSEIWKLCKKLTVVETKDQTWEK